MSLESELAEVVAAVVRAEIARTNPAPATFDPLQLLDSARVAELLCIEEDTARAWLASHKLPAFKVEGRWRVRRADLERYIARCAAGDRDGTPSPTEAAAALALEIRGKRKAG